MNPYAPSATLSEAPVVSEAAVLATRWERFAGALVDGLLQLIVVVPITFALGFGIAVGGLSELPEIVLELVGWLGALVAFLGFNGYLLATRGQTVGKVLMKTQIVDRRTNEVPPFGPLLLKRYSWLWLIAWVPGLGRLIPLINAVMIFRENRACLHDDVAGTKVVKIGAPVPVPPPTPVEPAL